MFLKIGFIVIVLILMGDYCEFLEDELWLDPRYFTPLPEPTENYYNHHHHHHTVSTCTSVIRVFKKIPTNVITLPPITNIQVRTDFFVISTHWNTVEKIFKLPRQTNLLLIQDTRFITWTKPVENAIAIDRVSATESLTAPTPTYVSISHVTKLEPATKTIIETVEAPTPVTTSTVFTTITTDLCLTISSTRIPTDTLTLQPTTVFETTSTSSTTTSWSTDTSSTTLIPVTTITSITGPPFSTTLVPITETSTTTSTSTSTIQEIAPTPTFVIETTQISVVSTTRTIVLTVASISTTSVTKITTSTVTVMQTVSCNGPGNKNCKPVVLRTATPVWEPTTTEPLLVIQPTRTSMQDPELSTMYISPSEQKLLEGLF